MKRLILLAFALCSAARSTGKSDLTERIIRMNETWNTFMRAYFSCPEASICEIRDGVIDYPSYLRARKAAMNLFELKDR